MVLWMLSSDFISCIY